jgi:hypothetical protein
VWFISWRIVAALAGARKIGRSPSNPSSTCSSANSGSTDATVAFRSRRPCSTSWRAPIVAGALVIDALRNIVSGAAAPAKLSCRTPSRSTTSAATPWHVPLSTASSSSPSILDPSKPMPLSSHCRRQAHRAVRAS